MNRVSIDCPDLRMNHFEKSSRENLWGNFHCNAEEWILENPPESGTMWKKVIVLRKQRKTKHSESSWIPFWLSNAKIQNGAIGKNEFQWRTYDSFQCRRPYAYLYFFTVISHLHSAICIAAGGRLIIQFYLLTTKVCMSASSSILWLQLFHFYPARWRHVVLVYVALLTSPLIDFAFHFGCCWRFTATRLSSTVICFVIVLVFCHSYDLINLVYGVVAK